MAESIPLTPAPRTPHPHITATRDSRGRGGGPPKPPRKFLRGRNERGKKRIASKPTRRSRGDNDLHESNGSPRGEDLTRALTALRDEARSAAAPSIAPQSHEPAPNRDGTEEGEEGKEGGGKKISPRVLRPRRRSSSCSSSSGLGGGLAGCARREGGAGSSPLTCLRSGGCVRCAPRVASSVHTGPGRVACRGASSRIPRPGA